MRVHRNCCGLDVHKQTIAACLISESEDGTSSRQKRIFGTMTQQLRELAQWLAEAKVTAVAMEATGIYWVPVWNYGVSNAAVQVGQYQGKSLWHGYILNGKSLTNVDDPKAPLGGTTALGLNPNGAVSVVGVYYTAEGIPEGFLYKNGKYTDILGPAGARQSYAHSINDSGAIVGSYVDSNSAMHGFLLKGKKYTTLDVPGATGTTATGINDAGWIVLYGTDSNGANSFLTKDDGKTYKTINVPDAKASFAEGLNSAGDVVYEWAGSGGADHVALLRAGKYYKFDYPKSVFTYGGGINDKNTVVGWYQINETGPVSGYKATYTFTNSR